MFFPIFADDLILRRNNKKMAISPWKIDIFTAVKYCSIFHGRLQQNT